MFKRTTPAILVALCAISLAACGPDELDEGATSETYAAILAGTRTTRRPEVGRYKACTATLISERHFISAAHCADFGFPTDGTFKLERTDGVVETYDVRNVWSLDSKRGPTDILVGELQDAVPESSATPARIAESAWTSAPATLFGYGCNVMSTGGGAGVRRYAPVHWGQAAPICEGDLGGPVFLGNSYGREIVAIASQIPYPGALGLAFSQTVFADATKAKPFIEAIVGRTFGLEPGWDRPGFDYLTITAASASVCKRACLKDTSCKAFTYQPATNRCWLKEVAPAPVGRAGFVSGVASGAVNYNRPGWDIANLSASSVAECAGACGSNNSCVAYTFVGATQHCWLKSRVPDATAGCPTCFSGDQRGFEAGYDRPGNDYLSFVPSARLGEGHCASACERDERCQAWSFVPRSHRLFADRCWLKERVSSPVRAPGLTSGVKRGLQIDVDRPGMDYTNFLVASPWQCQADCDASSVCKAWTFVPGAPGQAGRCWAKNGIPTGQVRRGMISGIRRQAHF